MLFDSSSGVSSDNASDDNDEESSDESGILLELFSGDKFIHIYLLC